MFVFVTTRLTTHCYAEISENKKC